MRDTSRLDVLIALQQRVAPRNLLEVMHGSYTWTAGFEWREGAKESAILQTQAELGLTIPCDYREFLRQCDGATLYKDPEFGQWGFVLYGTHELLTQNAMWRRSFQDQWSDTLLAFSENKGESSVLVFDTSRPSVGGQSCVILQATPYEPSEHWRTVSRSFSEWLSHLVTAQGDKYWEWL